MEQGESHSVNIDDIEEVIHPGTGEALKVGERGHEEFDCPVCKVMVFVVYFAVCDPAMPMKPFRVFACHGCKVFYWCRETEDGCEN